MENNWEFLVLFFPKWRQKQACLHQLHFLPSSALILLFPAQTSPSLTTFFPSSNSTHSFSSLTKMTYYFSTWLHTEDRRVVGGRIDQLSSHIPSITKPQVAIFTLPTGKNSRNLCRLAVSGKDWPWSFSLSLEMKNFHYDTHHCNLMAIPGYW